MTIHARVPAGALGGMTSLYRDFVSLPDGLLPWLPSYGAGALVAASAHAVAVEGGMATSLHASNEALGVGADVLSRLPGLADGSVRAVVTGQQPGVVGGALMSLHKAVAAIALARHIEKVTGRACVPLFWLGSDDDDFAEVRDLSVLGADYARLDVSMDASAYRPGLRIGDIEAAAVRSVWDVVVPALPGGTIRDRVTAALSSARDFADAAARALVVATAGQIAVIDGRDAGLRLAANELLLDFFDREDQLRALLDAGGRELEARGYHAQVQWGADSGLFLVRDGVRQRVPPDQRSAARAQFEHDITRASPGVVARNLVQDAVFSPVAVVLGPAEVAYRAQMAGIYREMNVAMPVVFPRLSATYLPPPVRDMVAELGLDAAVFSRDAAVAATEAAHHAVDDGFRAAANALQATFAAATRAFVEESAGRLDPRAQDRLKKRIDELAGRLAQTLGNAIEHDTRGPRSRWPFLPRMGEMFRKDSVPQERFLSLLTPMLFHGPEAWPSIDALAADWVADALDGRVWHGVYSV